MHQPKELPMRHGVAHANITPGTTPGSPLTHDGQRSLTRALGLKINRIVIDAGHGGHDTGTIGPHGLLEKDLCLDVALRLGHMIEERLPGAEVVYTRKDDTFVSLEQRTAIANEAHADLFISIHANSSHDPKARGIETFYLNFSTSQDAMEVAARENALAQTPIHDLQDMIQKIARNEKIEESKELAGDIQTSLSKKLQQNNHVELSRGVKRAPFVVLIGAEMPSVLTEISFISNPADEKLLKKTEERDVVAEGLFRGVSSYLASLNSLNFKQQKVVSIRPASLASGGNTK
jgi:N-acetylmuramoyl-L-alanine amidase